MSNEKTKATHLIPTGLLMEGDYTNYPSPAENWEKNQLIATSGLPAALYLAGDCFTANYSA